MTETTTNTDDTTDAERTTDDEHEPATDGDERESHRNAAHSNGGGESAADGTSSETAGATQRIDEYSLPPGPDGYPILDSLPQILRDPFDMFETLAAYGDVVRYSVLGFPFTALLHPDHIERVLVTDHERFDRNLFSKFGFDFAPEGLILTDGDQWRQQRQLLQPAFSITHIQSYADTMAEYAERTGETWMDGQEIALNRALSDLTLQILSKTLFGITVDPNEDDEAITRAAQLITERVDVQRLTTFLPTWIPTRANRQYNRAVREYRTRIDELIDRRRARNTDADDLLSILLHAKGTDGDTLSDAEVRDNLLTFMFAGHETSSLGLTYTFMLLAQHEAVGERLRREHETVLDGETPTFEHLQQLTYTENVIKEALRLYPPSHLLIRRATEDVIIDGYRIPKGTLLMLPQFWLHTDERFYDAPDEFKPDRWTDEFEDELPTYAYFPFGGGPRHCIGMRFAMIEMKLIVAVLAQQFTFDLLSDPNPEISAGAAHRPKEDILERRGEAFHEQRSLRETVMAAPKLVGAALTGAKKGLPLLSAMLKGFPSSFIGEPNPPEHEEAKWVNWGRRQRPSPRYARRARSHRL